MIICKECGSTPSQAATDATALSLQNEFKAGAYSCCQLIVWADEQWLAWSEAAIEDRQSAERPNR